MIAPPRIDIGGILKPRSVAVFGASDNKDKFAGRIMHYMVRHRFGGRLVPINPSRKEVLGFPAFPDIGSAPGPIDVAMLALPAGATVEAVRACAAAGVKAAIIMTTGFAEQADEEGFRREAELSDIRRSSGLRIVGPNCMGLIVPSCDMALSSSVVLECERLRPGRIGLVSQSGAIMVSLFDKAADAHIGFSACVSLGNQCDVEIAEVVDWMADDPGTEAITIYLEGLKDAPRFLAALAKAEAKGKPVLLVKTGRTPEGERAARSHTASLAGSYRVLEAACRRHGVLMTDDPDGMIRAADLMLRWRKAPGDGVAVISPSGGGAGIAVDRLSTEGVRLARLSESTKTRLREYLRPPQADNPLDLGGRLRGESMESAHACAELLGSDPDVGFQFMVMTTSPFFEATTREVARTALALEKPVVALVTPGAAGAGPRRALSELGCPSFDTMDEAIRVIGLYLRRQRNLGRPLRGAPPRPPGLAPVDCSHLPTGRLTEPETKALLKTYGVPVTRERLVRTEAEAVAAADAIGYPVAMKAVARDLVHKSDVGGVKLRLASPTDVSAALRDIARGLSAAKLGPPEGFLVTEMAAGRAEVIVGIRRDEQFGPVVLAGTGGIFVEIADDVQIALAPVSKDESLALLRSLRGWPLLAGVRSPSPLDVDAVADILVRLGWLAADLGPRLVDLEVNPLIVRLAGEGAVAVDGRATLT